MPKLAQDGGETLTEMRFPLAGVDLRYGFGDQRPRPVLGDYRRTTILGNNVRGFEPSTNRARGGSRPGLNKWIPQRVGNLAWIVQALDLLVGSGYAAPGGGSVASASGRVVTLIAVSQGNVYVANAGDTVWTSTTNATGNTPPLIFTGRLFSAANQQKMWFADGTNWCYYDPADNTVKTWAASAGSLPVDTSSNTPRLITTWRGRTVLSGLLKDEQNVFFSKVADPTNFDYSPVSKSEIDAVALGASKFGNVGDMVTCLIPFSDDVLIIGGDHTIWVMRGDPAAGGSLDLLSDAVGICWGMPWCKGPDGTVYFVSNHMGVYAISHGQFGGVAPPQRISQAIEQRIQQIDSGLTGLRLLWDERYQGFHLFATTLAAPTLSDVHYFYEQRTGAWWTDTFGNKKLNPICCCVFDGNSSDDRAPLIAGWDGYVRAISTTAVDDDGTPIDSEVLIGPILTPNLDEVTLYEIQEVLGEGSSVVDYEVLAGATAEAASTADPMVSGTFGRGRNLSQPIRVSAHAIYIRVASLLQWSMESLRARIGTRGKIRMRGA